MAAITSAATGLSNVGSTWVGGVVPVEGDTVTIAAGHTVTITGTHVWGNDSATAALTIAGSCVFSTTANTDLTLKGTLVESGTAAVWRRGTLASPIPANITSKVRVNYSATLANNKYNITFGNTNKFAEWSECGATKNRQFQVAAAIPAGATSITVSDATGWQVGDIIFLEATNTTATQREHRVLTSVSGNVVGWATGLTNARIAGCWGGNLSSNVLWQSYSASFGSYLNIVCNSASSVAIINIKHVAFFGLYGINSLGGFHISGTNALTVANSPVGIIDNITACDLLPDGSNATGNLGLIGVGIGYAGSWSNPLIYSRQGYSNGLSSVYASSGGTIYINNPFFCGIYGIFLSQFSQGGVGCKIIGGRITNNNNINNGASMIGLLMQNVTMDGSSYLLGILQGDYTFNNCSFGQTYGFANTTQLITNSANALSTITINACLLPNTSVVLPSTYQNALANKPVILLNKNGIATQQEIYLNTGSIIRDNTQLIRSRSSIKFSPYIANTAHGYSFTVAASSGVAYTFRFGLRYDSTYGTATPPSVTVSGLGITPQTFTAGASANVNYSGTITVTPTSTGLLTIAISGTTTSTLGTGNFWFSGMSVDPWINWTQHYGYAYAPTIPTLTVDPVVVLSESAAAALTGIAYSAGTITISSTRTLSELYDWFKQYEAANQLAPLITSSDGKTFVTAANVVISGSLSGGTLTAAGVTLSGTATNITFNCNVAQATPTALSSVNVTGSLTYNVATATTVTLTGCTLGTVSNSGAGAVTVRRTNTTIGTVGSNVTAPLVTSLVLAGLTNAAAIYVSDSLGNQVDFVFSVLTGAQAVTLVNGEFTQGLTSGGAVVALGTLGTGGTYTLDTTGGANAPWTYKIAQYGKFSTTGTHNPLTGSTNATITLTTDSYITQSSSATVNGYTTIDTPEKLYDALALYETTLAGIKLPSRITGKLAGAVSVGSYALVFDPSATSAYTVSGSTLTLKTSSFTASTVFTDGVYTVSTLTINSGTTVSSGFRSDDAVVNNGTVTGTITASTFTNNGSINGSTVNCLQVYQPTNINLSNVRINGSLAYTNTTAATVVFTDVSVSSAVYTYATTLTISLAGTSSIGIRGIGVTTRAYTFLQLQGLPACSAIYVANGTGTLVEYIASSGTSYSRETSGGTGTWSWKVAKYGSLAQSGTHSPASATTTAAITLATDPFISEASASLVAAYSQLTTPDRLYDYAAYWETTSAGISRARVASKAGSYCSVGSLSVTMASSGAVWNLSGSTLTINTGTAWAPGTTMTSGLLTSGSITAADTSAFTGLLSDSTGVRAPLAIAPNVSLVGAQVRIYDLDSFLVGDLGTELAGVASAPAATYTHFSLAGNSIWIQILKDGYQEYGASVTTPSAAATLSPILQVDYNA